MASERGNFPRLIPRRGNIPIRPRAIGTLFDMESRGTVHAPTRPRQLGSQIISVTLAAIPGA